MIRRVPQRTVFAWAASLLIGILGPRIAAEEETVSPRAIRLQVDAGAEHPVNTLATTRDGTLFFTGEGSLLRIWSGRSQRVLRAFTLNDSIQEIVPIEAQGVVFVNTTTQSFRFSLETLEQLNRSWSPVRPSIVYQADMDMIYAMSSGAQRYPIQIDPTRDRAEALTESYGNLPAAEGGPAKPGFRADHRFFTHNFERLIVVSPRWFGVFNTDFIELEAIEKTFRADVIPFDLDEEFFGYITAAPETDALGNAGEYLLEILSKSDFATVARLQLQSVEIGEGPVRAPRESTFDPDTGAFYLQTEKHLLKFVFAEGRLSFSRHIPLPETGGSGTRQIEHFVRVPEPAPGVPPFLLATTSKDSATTGELGRWSGGESLANFERIGHRPLTPRRLFAHPSAEEFYLQSGPSEFKRIRLLPGGLEVSELPTAGAYRIVLDPNGRFFLSGNTSGRPKRQEIATLQPTSEWPAPALLGPEHNVRLYAQDYALSDDGRYLAGNRSGALELFDLQENGKRLLNLDEGYFAMPNLPGLVAISPDNRSVAFATAPKQAGTSLAEYTVVCVDLETLSERWRKIAYGTIAHLHFLDDATLAFFSDRNAALQTVDVATGDQLNMTFASAHPAIRPGSQSVSHHAMAYSRDGSHIAFAVDGAVSILHRETLSARFHLPVLSSRVLSLAFFTNPRYLLVGTEDQQVLLYDLEAEKPLVTMAFFGDDNEWVLTSPDLRFQSSTGAADRLYVVKERDTLPLGALYEKFHTPRLLHRLLDGEALSPMLPPESLQAAPEVALEWVDENGRALESPPATDTVRLRVTASSEASEVAEIRLYHNGKIVSARQRGLVVEDDAIEPESPSLYTLSRTYVLGRLDGPNTFRAIALNRQRTESAPASIELSDDTDAPSRGFTLHLFVVGIDAYANPKYNLNYATADAEAFLERIQEGAGSVFSQIRTTYLHDAGASRSKILESFEAIAASAQPRDVLVFYYAGHGVMSSEIEPEFYLVPSEVTQLYGNDELLRERAISAGELRELAARIPAQKQLFILDACQSAGALQTVAMRGAAEEKAIAQLARSTGTHWLTATGSDQFAAEFETLGHGVFTYSILQALQGAADTGDGQVTVRELDAFLQQRVPELTKEHRGLPQYPASYGFGQDFPLSLVPQKP